MNNTSQQQSFQMLPVGTVLDGRYRIERYLASGGFGNTYVAFDTRFNSRVAIKEFFMRGTNHRDVDSSAVLVSNVANVDGFNQQLDKFRREAKRIFDMRNDHIVHVIDLFDANGTSYYVMDFIEGESLSARVKRNPLPEAEVRDVAAQLLDALDAVHKAGFFHLDVKPGNIMIDKDGHCTLIDFGASKQMSAMERTSMSASGMAYTPGYAPIEQEMQRMKSIGPWTDFYAVGATLYNLLTGQRPPEVDPDDTAEGSRIFDYPSGVSMIMRHAVSCMMNPSPRKRPQNVEEVKALLEGRFVRKSDVGEDAVTAQSPQSATYSIPPSTGSLEASGIKKTKLKKWIWSLIGVVALGLSAFIIILLNGKNGKEKADVAEDVVPESGVTEKDRTTVVQQQEEIEKTSLFEDVLTVLNYHGKIGNNIKDLEKTRFELKYQSKDGYEDEPSTETAYYGYDVTIYPKDDNTVDMEAKSPKACVMYYQADTSSGWVLYFKEKSEADKFLKQAEEYGLYVYEFLDQVYGIPRRRLPEGGIVKCSDIDESIVMIDKQPTYNDGWWVFSCYNM